MELDLTDIEARVLGSLLEKALSTPEYYPLSLNALTNACNQKSSREPVTDYTEAEMRQAASELIKKELVHLSQVGRVPKYEELFSRKRSLVPKESAVLAVLLLRGPQTAGELRGRTERLYEFASLDEVLATLADLESWSLVRRLERQAGRKEPRYHHLLGTAPAHAPEKAPAPASSDPAEAAADRLSTLEARVAALEEELEAMRAAFRDFRAKFE